MSTGEAIQQLRDTENLLMKKQEVLEKKIEQELECAKKNGTKNKRGEEKWSLAMPCAKQILDFNVFVVVVVGSKDLNVNILTSVSVCVANLQIEWGTWCACSCCAYRCRVERSCCIRMNFTIYINEDLTFGFHSSVFSFFYFLFSAAIQALKRKKRYEKQLQQIDGTLSTIEMQREALEGANTNTAVLTTMKSAADALKAAHQHM